MSRAYDTRSSRAEILYGRLAANALPCIDLEEDGNPIEGLSMHIRGMHIIEHHESMGVDRPQGWTGHRGDIRERRVLSLKECEAIALLILKPRVEKSLPLLVWHASDERGRSFIFLLGRRVNQQVVRLNAAVDVYGGSDPSLAMSWEDSGISHEDRAIARVGENERTR